MGNTSSSGVKKQSADEFPKIFPENSGALSHSPTTSQPITVSSNAIRGRYSLQLTTPIPPRMVRTSSQNSVEKDDLKDAQECDEPPLSPFQMPRTSDACEGRDSENDLFKLFRKQLAETDEASLLEARLPCDKDLISVAMEDIKTRASSGPSHDDDDDVISMSTFQNIKPFEFHQKLRSSRDIIDAYHIRPAKRFLNE